MARNYPPCEWIVNSSFDLAEETQVTVYDVNCTVDVSESCSECVYHTLSDAYVYTLIVCYSIIMTLGLLGNIAAIAIILSVRELRIVINLLLVALAFSDIIITIAMPFNFLAKISYQDSTPPALCKFVPLLQGTAIMSGIYTLVVIALERYYVIVHPFKIRILNSPRRIGVCIGFIWLVSTCLQIPLAMALDIEILGGVIAVPALELVEYCEEICIDTSQRLCVETWSLESAIAFSYVVLVLMYILPLICISFLYFLIGRAMWRRRPVGNASAREVTLYKEKKRVITFMVVLVASFAVLWGPYFVMPCLVEPIENVNVATVLQVMGHVNVAINPILYAYFHRNVRKQAVVCMRRASVLLMGKADDDMHSASAAARNQANSDKESEYPGISSISIGNGNVTGETSSSFGAIATTEL